MAIKNSNSLKEPEIEIDVSPLFPNKSEHSIKREKSKKRRVRQYIIDFTDFLPESLIAINRTNIHARVRIGDRYQAKM